MSEKKKKEPEVTITIRWPMSLWRRIKIACINKTVDSVQQVAVKGAEMFMDKAEKEEDPSSPTAQDSPPQE